jgi:hypothetical protein
MKETTIIIGTELTTVLMTGADTIRKTEILNIATGKEVIRVEAIK